MSQYGYIPINQIGNSTIHYSIVGPNDGWQFEKQGQVYAGLEEIIFTQAQKEEIENLGGEWFENSSSFVAWMNGSDAVALKRQDIAFGNGLLLEFLTGQKDIALDNMTYRAVSETFKYAESALRRGDIPQAKTELTNIALSPPVWTQDAKDYFIYKINNYLGI